MDFQEFLSDLLPASLPLVEFQDEFRTVELIEDRNLITKIDKWLKDLPDITLGSSKTAKEMLKQASNKSLDEITRIQLLTKAIFFAKDIETESEAHFQRGALLFSLSCFRVAYDDFLSLDDTSSYRQRKRAPLAYWKSLCSFKLGEKVNLESHLSEIESLFSDVSDQWVIGSRNIKPEINKLKRFLHDGEPEVAVDAIESAPGCQIELKFNQAKGKFIVAADRIQENEEILTEKAFAFVPIASDLFLCQNCAATNVVPFPCRKCKKASCCSRRCWTEFALVHEVECQGWRKALWENVGIAYLAFRCFLNGFFQHFTEKEIKMSDIDRILSDVGGTYKEVLDLMTNFHKMPSSDRLSYALTAVILSRYLHEQIPFIGPKMDFEIFSAGLLMRHIGQMISNAHTISDLELNFDNQPFPYSPEMKFMPDLVLLNVESRQFFTAIFPQIAILNHSCDPNIRNRFNGSELSVFATREIGPGEEIFNNYGENYRLRRKKERQEALRGQYFFDCECQKCIDKGEDEALELDKVLCPICGGTLNANLDFEAMKVSPREKPCDNCGNMVEFDELNQALATVSETHESILALRHSYEQCCRSLGKHNDFLFYLSRKLIEIGLEERQKSEKAQQFLENLANHLLEETEYRFGKFSPEYVAEMFLAVKVSSKFKNRFGGIHSVLSSRSEAFLDAVLARISPE